MRARIGKLLKIGIPVLLVIVALLVWWRYFYVFGEGVRAGNLNFIVKKGYVFKTWEGRLIQTGFKSPAPGGLQSNEFSFSVAGDSLGHILEKCSGKSVELRYREYLHPVPWRGMSPYVVIEILKVSETPSSSTLPY